jgi:type IV secretion system protein VirB8
VRDARTVQRGGQSTVSHWMATVAYDYVSAPLSDADRLINPLGFSVRDYRIDPETP